MDSARMVGSSGVRLATALLMLALAGSVWLLRTARLPNARTVLLIVTVALGLATFMGLIHCFRALYAGWLAFAGVLHVIAVNAIFGACYLLVVPFFRLIVLPFDPLRLRKRAGAASFWVDREKDPGPDSFERMG
jgi:3-hydroxy-3-methylglutaryl CoA synthase